MQPSLNLITRGETAVRLRPQLMDLLACLADRAGRTVTKDELLDLVWPDQYIVESGLARCVAELRQILGDAARRNSRYIETIPKRGYRLIAPVGFLTDEPDGPAPPAVGERPSTSCAADGLPASPPDAAAPPPAGRRRWIVVAVAGAVLLAAAATIAWRALRPPPTAAPDRLVLAFENSTGDAAFDDLLRLALQAQAEQSPNLRIVGEQRVRAELSSMHLPADTAISRKVAQEVCRRIGAKAVLAGTLAGVDGRYLIGVEARECRAGIVLVRNQVEVEGRDLVLGGLSRAVSEIRRELGASVASIRRSGVPIVGAATPSLDATEVFGFGHRARGGGDDSEAVPLSCRAIPLGLSSVLA